MTELIEFLVKALVEDPGAVVVDELEEDGDLVYEVSVAEGDLGRVIGKGGRVARVGMPGSCNVERAGARTAPLI